MLTQIYQDVQAKVLKEIVRRPPTTPWMKQREIDVIEEVLRNLRPASSLEWGAGYSTIHFPKLLPPNARWVSIEHNEAWATEIRERNRNPNVHIFHVPRRGFGATDDSREGDHAGFESYVRFAEKFATFDFILVDGRARRDCLMLAHTLLNAEGVVILHDANRGYHREPSRLYTYRMLFQDYRTAGGGLWVGSKGTDLDTVLDVEKHRRLWQLYCGIGKTLRL